MSPRSPRDPGKRFEDAYQGYQSFITEQPVESVALFDVIDNLEKTGYGLIGAGNLEPVRFAQTMHRVFSQIVDLETTPKLSDDQRKFVAAKVSVYGIAVEQTEPKPKRSVTKQTDTRAIPTDKSKP